MELEQRIKRLLDKVGLVKDRNITNQIIKKISREREMKAELPVKKTVSQIKNDHSREAGLDLILLSRPSSFEKSLGHLRRNLDSLLHTSDSSFHENAFLFLTNLTINLKSFLPFWNLEYEDSALQESLSKSAIEGQISKNRSLLKKWEKKSLAFRRKELGLLGQGVSERLKSEGVSTDDLDETVREVAGDGIDHYLDQMFSFVETSNLKKVSDMRKNGTTITELGNDYAAHLQETMWLGASFTTTNPELVYLNLERKLDLSDVRVDEMTRRFLNENQLTRTTGLREDTVEKFINILTCEVVLNNARLLRGIFLLSRGSKGYVCLQVNPAAHGDAKRMIEEALKSYSYLYQQLGGIPNVVFKLPATKAGLESAEVLTKVGIGVTITVQFGLFQLIPFAKAVSSGEAIVSHLALMNGRLAFPVRDELLSLGLPGARKAARYAGVAVAKKAYGSLYSKDELGLNPAEVKLLIASLRNYDDFFPDITELIGVPIITVFPNIRHEFDGHPRDLDPSAVEKPVDKSILTSLSQSELFKQAYYTPGDPELFRPHSMLSLDETGEVQSWNPAKTTMDGFINAREKTQDKLKKRMKDILSS